MNKRLALSHVRQAAGLLVVCLLATLLPGAHAPQSVADAPSAAYRAYFPLVGAAPPRYRVFLPLFAAETTEELGRSPGKLMAAVASRMAAGSTSGLVTRQEEELWLNGEAYRFVGTNAYYLAGPFFPESEVAGIIAYLSASGVQVIRVFVLPWCDLDRVERMLDLGHNYDIRFILTLQDFFGNLDGSCFDRYETTDLPHIRNVVSRFAERPEVLLWELMNEPTCPAGDSGQDCWDSLYAWAQITSREIKRLDPNHLVAVGSQGAGLDSQALESYRRVHTLDTIDLVSVHREAGKRTEKELAIAHELGKPVYVGEVYMRGHDESCQPLPDNTLERRAQAIAADLQCSMEAGMDGYLLWQYAHGGVDMGSHIEYFCGVFEYFADDPVWEVIREATEVSPSHSPKP